MPHHYSWSFGWEEMVQEVAKAYQSVPVADRGDTAVFANDFAAAGAIDLIGPKYGLPKAIGGHQSYWLWGPRQFSGQTMIILGRTLDAAHGWFNDVTVVADLHNPYAAPWENGPVLLCRQPNGSIRSLKRGRNSRIGIEVRYLLRQRIHKYYERLHTKPLIILQTC